MKATGIVRRIDDLGRVVIPKEIRRTLRIKEGTPLEIFTDREGEVILKKYSPIGELSIFAREYAEALAQKIRGFDRKNRTIALGVCSPAPSWLITPLLNSLYPGRMIQSETADEAVLLAGLASGTYQLIVLSREVQDAAYISKPCGR